MLNNIATSFKVKSWIRNGVGAAVKKIGSII